MIPHSAYMILVVVWCASTVARAGISAPIPFAKLSKDESKILVIRDGGNGFSDSQVINPKLSNGEKIDFLAEYPRSGVYKTGTKRLEYPIDWFCLERELLADDDLQFVARLNRFGGDWALKFYASGKEVRSFKMEELLTSFTAEQYRPFVTWDYFHPWHDDFKIRGGKVILTTVEREISGFRIGYKETYTFELVTGELQQTEVQNIPFLILLGVLGLLVFSIISVVLAAKARRRESKTQNNKRCSEG